MIFESLPTTGPPACGADVISQLLLQHHVYQHHVYHPATMIPTMVTINSRSETVSKSSITYFIL